ncbi:hypothetical protein DFJ73DRAFT_22340 [Zopfochytrium polystomum]|nr:hypothetical protein DFJ73DRAFT_22340 [Zopfochytrium polystomum]
MPSTPATLSASIELPIPPSPSSDLLTSSSTSSSSVAGRQMAASAAAGAPSKSAHSAQLPVSRDVKARLGIIASPVVAHPEQQLAIPSTSNQHRRGPSGGSSPSFVYQSATIDDASSLQPKEDQDAAGSSFSNLTLRKLAMPTNSNTSSSRGVFEAQRSSFQVLRVTRSARTPPLFAQSVPTISLKSFDCQRTSSEMHRLQQHLRFP